MESVEKLTSEHLPSDQHGVRMEARRPVDLASLTPFNYQLALRNRIPRRKLSAGGSYDVRAYSSFFIYDCLMLPGSLAAVLGKQSPEDLLRRTTPAALPGFYTQTHPQTHQPCLVASASSSDCTRGMVLVGQGREARRRLNDHYCPSAKRTKVKVEIDLLHHTAQSSSDSLEAGVGPVLRTPIWAYTWLWTEIEPFKADVCLPRWNLFDYLIGVYASVQDTESKDTIPSSFALCGTTRRHYGDHPNRGSEEEESNLLPASGPT